MAQCSMCFVPRRANHGHDVSTEPKEGLGSAPAVGLEPSPEDLGGRDSVAIARKGVDGKTSPKSSESDSTAPHRTRVPDSDSIDAILAHARLAWRTMRVIGASERRARAITGGPSSWRPPAFRRRSPLSLRAQRFQLRGHFRTQCQTEWGSLIRSGQIWNPRAERSQLPVRSR